MGLRNRLRRLDNRLGTEPCAGCGLRPQERGYIVVRGSVERDDAPEELPEVCPECGRYTRTVINVVYEDLPGASEAKRGLR